MSHVNHLSHVIHIIRVIHVSHVSDPWDMLNNFCFLVYAQKSLFVGENGNVFLKAAAPAPVTRGIIQLESN